VTSLSTASDGLSAAHSLNGARSQQVQQTVAQLTQNQSSLQSLLTTNEDANMAQVLSLLSQQQTVYQASVSVGSRANQNTLFDFLK
jgi:flagellar hook-associated protein 3 FlgL